MNMKKIVTSSVVAGAVALAVVNLAGEAEADDKKKKEKCYGVVEAGQNGCANAAGTHSCVGQATVDGDGGEWIALPAGVCDKLVGGSVEPYEGTELPAAE